ncbi:MAG: hypothetical protein HXY29_06690 [Rhodocyclaceae bacterium]|jgi:hypothetical protein|nr:hypothetical protein [Rhodocyclaceae bacterium]
MYAETPTINPCPQTAAARLPGAIPEAATGWLRFGVMALPKTAPPRVSS